jgi:hypothetical protein
MIFFEFDEGRISFITYAAAGRVCSSLELAAYMTAEEGTSAAGSGPTASPAPATESESARKIETTAAPVLPVPVFMSFSLRIRKSPPPRPLCGAPE